MPITRSQTKMQRQILLKQHLDKLDWVYLSTDKQTEKQLEEMQIEMAKEDTRQIEEQRQVNEQIKEQIKEEKRQIKEKRRQIKEQKFITQQVHLQINEQLEKYKQHISIGQTFQEFKNYCYNVFDVSNKLRTLPNYKTCDILYFDNIRIFTELYYYITEIIDSLFIVNGALNLYFEKLFNTIYLKLIYFVKEHTKRKPKTYEHQQVLNSFKQQLQTCQIKMYPYITEKPKRTPIISYVEFWDSEDEDEDITDPDYDPIKEREYYKNNK